MNIQVIIRFLYHVSFDIFRCPVTDDLLVSPAFCWVIRVTKAECVMFEKMIVQYLTIADSVGRSVPENKKTRGSKRS